MKRIIFFASLVVVCFLGLIVWQYVQFSDNRLHIVFCRVGQGDAIFIRTPGGKTILLDGGPDASVLSCLASHMPFWKRGIDLMLLSHPHADHLNGLISVLDRYHVAYFATEPLTNKTAGYDALLRELKTQNVKIKTLLSGDRITIEPGIALEILGPTQQYLDETSPKGTIGESAEFGSMIQLLSYGDFDVLFDGDSQVSGMMTALKRVNGEAIEIMQVPHHGSRFGLDKTILSQISPKLAVISVGKNTYGHPATTILRLFHDMGIRFVRTDQDGSIEIVSDGKKWWIRR